MNSNASSSSDHYFKSTLFPNKKRWHHLRYMWPEAAAVNTVEKEEAARWKLVHFRFPAFENTKREDVVRCFDSLSVKRNQRPITIAFVGDSTARQHYLSLIRVSIQLYYSPFHFTHIVEYCINYYRRFLITTGNFKVVTTPKFPRNFITTTWIWPVICWLIWNSRSIGEI